MARLPRRLNWQCALLIILRLISVDPYHIYACTYLEGAKLEMSAALESLLEMGFPKNKAYVDRWW